MPALTGKPDHGPEIQHKPLLHEDEVAHPHAHAEPAALGHGDPTALMPYVDPDLAGTPMRVIADGLNVRSAPEMADNVVGGLAHGHTIHAIGHEGEWTRFLFDGGHAFVKASFLAPVGGAPMHAAPVTAPARPIQHAAPAPPHAPHVAPQPPAPPAPVLAPGHALPEAHHDSQPPGAPVSHAAPAPEPHPTVTPPSHAPDHVAVHDHPKASADQQDGELKVLADLRKDPRRFDPTWLMNAQVKLHVNATGAMNIDTLRAMREAAQNPHLDAHGLMNEGFLITLAPGKPFLPAEYGNHKVAADPHAHSNKDKTAQDVGYASYADYQVDWTTIKLLGKTLGQGHRYLAARVHAADAYLRQRAPQLDKDLAAKGDAGIRQAVGWTGEGNASYHDDPGNPQTHQHAMGLAIDIDKNQNVYLFDHHVQGITSEQSDWWVSTFVHMSLIASKLFGGDPIDAPTLDTWSKQMTTDQLYAHVQSANEAFNSLLKMSRTMKEPDIKAKLAEHGFTDPKKDVEAVVNADKWFHLQEGRREAKGMMNISLEMVIALRDVAGLAWGGTEMSSTENGDFMHFDCRLTDFGGSVYAAGKRHKP